MFGRYRRYRGFRRRRYSPRFIRRRSKSFYGRWKRRGNYAINNLSKRYQVQKVRAEAQAFRRLFEKIKKGDSPELVLSDLQQSMPERLGKNKRTDFQQFVWNFLRGKGDNATHSPIGQTQQENEIWNSFKAFQKATQQQMGIGGQTINQQDSGVHKEDPQLRRIRDSGGGTTTTRRKERSEGSSSTDQRARIGSSNRGVSSQIHPASSGNEKIISVLPAETKTTMERSKSVDPMGRPRIRENQISMESGPQSLSSNGAREQSKPLDGQLPWTEDDIVRRIQGTNTNNNDGQNLGRISSNNGGKGVNSHSTMDISFNNQQPRSKIMVSGPTPDDARCIFQESDEDCSLQDDEEQDFFSSANVQAA